MRAAVRHGGTVVRVDGDVVEIFGAVGFSHRYLLPSLRVEVQPSDKGTLVVRSAWAHTGRQVPNRGRTAGRDPRGPLMSGRSTPQPVTAARCSARSRLTAVHERCH